MKFKEFICFDAIIPALQATDRDGAIAELVSALVKAGKLSAGQAKDVTKAVVKRENEASTGMGKGVAVPHVKNPDRHLQAMENVFKHLQKERFRKFLRQCRTPHDLEDLLNEADEGPSW